MRFRRFPAPAIAIAATLSYGVPVAAHAERAVFNFNPAWLLAVADPANAANVDFDDTAWKAVTLPCA